MDSIKQDINFFEYPLWFQDVRSNKDFIWNDIEGYEYCAKYKAPIKTDYVFLLCLLHESQKQNWNPRLTLTRNYILQKSGLKKNKQLYNRLEDSLNRWKYVGIHFEGNFYDGKKYQSLNFGIIETWSINQDSKKLYVRFNEDWILKIKNSVFYKLIDFNIVKKLRSPLTVRLYEIFIKSFQKRNTWKIDATKLAKKIPLQKKYPSQIYQAVYPAVNRIRRETNLNVYMEQDKKQRGIVIFIFTLKENKKKLSESLTKTESITALLKHVPSEHVSDLKKIISNTLDKKSIEYIENSILYTNSKNPDNYPAYLAEVLRNGYANNFDSEYKKHTNKKKQAKECYSKCKGSCAAIWENYREKKDSACHWCELFKNQKSVF